MRSTLELVVGSILSVFLCTALLTLFSEYSSSGSSLAGKQTFEIPSDITYVPRGFVSCPNCDSIGGKIEQNSHEMLKSIEKMKSIQDELGRAKSLLSDLESALRSAGMSNPTNYPPGATAQRNQYLIKITNLQFTLDGIEEKINVLKKRNEFLSMDLSKCTCPEIKPLSHSPAG